MNSNASFKEEIRVLATIISNRVMTSAWVRTDIICPRVPAVSTVDVNRWFSGFHLSTFSSNNLSLDSRIFYYSLILLRLLFFAFLFIYSSAKIYFVTEIQPAKMLCIAKAVPRYYLAQKPSLVALS